MSNFIPLPPTYAIVDPQARAVLDVLTRNMQVVIDSGTIISTNTTLSPIGGPSTFGSPVSSTNVTNLAPSYTLDTLTADLKRGAAEVITGVTNGTTVMKLEPAGQYVVFQHKDAVVLGTTGTYAGTIRTGLGITSTGIIGGYNRTSDGAWQTTFAIESATGNLTLLGELRANSVVNVGAYLGSTLVSDVVTNAASVTTKLNKSAADILTGDIIFQSAGGFKTGSIAIDGSGNVTGAGVAFTSRGIVGRNAGATTFTIDADTGAATFKGDITGASGTFTGSITGASGQFSGDLITTGRLSLTGTGNVIAGYSVSQYINSSASYACIYANNTANASVATFYTGNARTIYAQNNSTFSANAAIVGDNIGNGAGIQATANTGTALIAYAASGNAFACQGAMTITSNALVTNLNADRLDDYHASSFFLLGGALGTPSSGNLANCSFPTLNQNTTGNAATASLASDSNSLGGVTASSWARIFATNSGNANAGGSGVNILGSTSTGIVDAYVGTSGTSNIVTIDVRTTSPSDIRLKEEIADSDLGLAFVKQLRPVSYKLKADPKHQKGYGFIADEVDQIIETGSSLVYHEPNWKVGDETGFKTIHYPSYIAVLTKAIQELSAKVEALETQLKG